MNKNKQQINAKLILHNEIDLVYECIGLSLVTIFSNRQLYIYSKL